MLDVISKKYRKIYFIIGFILGTCFPIVGILIKLSFTNSSSNLPAYYDPLFFIICTAPIILSSIAYFAGKKQDELLAMISECNLTEQQLTVANEKISNTVKRLEIQEKDLILAKDAAEHADKLKSEFLAQMSHEIRTPISTILNYNSLIEEEFKNISSPDIDQSFESIKKASNRLIRTIDMILNLSNIESGTYTPKFENIMLKSEILEYLVQEFSQTAKSKNLFLKICNQFVEDKLIRVDKYTITQAIANIIDNAIKYTEDGGVTVCYKIENEKCHIEISDTGIGISKDFIPKLFDKFSQETEGYTRRYDGNGLGLTLVQKYCEINNATISIQSTQNVGSNFKIEIPVK